MSEARPLPSQTTTGTGGSSLRYSSTIETTLGPPSTTRPTTGTPWPSPATQPHYFGLQASMEHHPLVLNANTAKSTSFLPQGFPYGASVDQQAD